MRVLVPVLVLLAVEDSKGRFGRLCTVVLMPRWDQDNFGHPRHQSEPVQNEGTQSTEGPTSMLSLHSAQ